MQRMYLPLNFRRSPGVMMYHNTVLGFIGALIFISMMYGAVPARGDTNEELQQKINESNAKIAALEKEIAQYEGQLVNIGNQKKTLEGEVGRLDLSRKKIGTDIAVTENRVSAATLQLEDLGGEISTKEQRILNGKKAIGQSFRTLNQIGDTTLVEHILAATRLTEAWEESDKLRQLEGNIQNEIKVLQTTKEELTVNYRSVEERRAQLVSLKKELAGQKAILDQNRREQATLLSQTKNKESEYQKLLDEKRQAKADFEREISEFEAAIAYNLDPTTIPNPGSGVLSSPMPSDFMARCGTQQKTFGNLYCITQYFGNTPFAQSGAYNGQGHNGVDFGIPEGTRIGSALAGVVQATGNTDAYKGCYSYGKWVLVKHGNGLTTLYAHLSHISVSAGDSLPTGGLIGYSGKTGYATGPHLHLTAYVSDAVQIVRLGDIKAKTNCANALVPVAPTAAYVNPMQYL